MSDQKNSGSFWPFVWGLGLGVAAGLLLAPKSGRENRRRLSRWLDDLEEEGRALWARGKEAAERSSEKMKDTMETLLDDVEDRLS